MIAKGIGGFELRRCLQAVNEKRGYRLIFNREPERQGNWTPFTIRSEVSKVPGARTTPDGRNLISASWHAHGFLFDEILGQDPDAVIVTGSTRVTSGGGNWQDIQIGSMMNPCMMSQTSIL